MKSKMTWIGLAGLILVCIAMSAMTGGQSAADAPEAKYNTDKDKLQLSFETDKIEYSHGETINFMMVLSNPGEQAQNLIFTSGQSFDISATPKDAEKPVWRWAQGRMFTRSIREVTLQPGETLKLEGQWDQKTNSGEIALRGEYSVQAEIAAMERIKSAPIQIQLVP